MTCGFTGTGSLSNADPKLGPLADNGGPTLTMALQSGSAAIDAGSNAIAAAPPVNNVDQRGITRPIDGNSDSIAVSDIGAYEAPAPTLSAPTATAASDVTSSSFTANWSSVSGATGYRLDVSTKKSFTPYLAGYQNLDVGNATSYSVTGLKANTNYYYRVRAYNGAATSPNSNVIKVTTTKH